MISNQRGKNPFPQFLEDRGVPKERSDRDKEVLAQRICFPTVQFQIRDIVCQPSESAEGHAPPGAPPEGAVFVVREIHSGGASQQPEKFV